MNLIDTLKIGYDHSVSISEDEKGRIFTCFHSEVLGYLHNTKTEHTYYKCFNIHRYWFNKKWKYEGGWKTKKEFWRNENNKK